MDQININKILERENITERIKQHVTKKDASGIYIYGDYGIGKTQFVVSILKEMNYDVLIYDTHHVRNVAFFHEISKNGISNKNVTSMFHKKSKEVVIVMDEIDGMIANDKGGISALIKLIQPNKKNAATHATKHLPIFCIASNKTNKKVKDLMKVCEVFELKKPSYSQMRDILAELQPNNTCEQTDKIIEMVQGDLRKLRRFMDVSHKAHNMNWIDQIHTKYSNDDAKTAVKKLMVTPCSIQDHAYINESDRSIIGLLWHENIVDMLAKVDKKKSIPFYIGQLENICFSDYIERITFQKQIWQLNEMCSLIKTMYNNKLLFDEKPKWITGAGASSGSGGCTLKEVRFTKILTKYSTEYNNSLFLNHLCQLLGYDLSDLLVFFSTMDATREQELLKHTEISKLDIKRMQRYIEKYTKENAVGIKEVDYDEETIGEITDT